MKDLQTAVDDLFKSKPSAPRAPSRTPTKRVLSDWLQAYLEYSSYSEAPEMFHFWSGVSTLAGALRRKVWIDQTYFQWTPNFYIVFVAPPGIVSKSTTMSIGMRLLKQIPDIKFGPDAVTWQALTESLANATEEIANPKTGEYHPMSCITIASSEFGTFLDPSDRAMVDALVSLWDGQIGVWEKATKTQGSDTIVNPWINMIACTTPSWIAQNFPEYMIGGGFTSRCIFVYGEEKRHLVAYPGLSVPKDITKLEADLVNDLHIISSMMGEMTLSPAAVKLGHAWYKQHYNSTLDEKYNDSKIAGYRARKQTHVHKLAIILAASRSSSLIVEEEDLIRAIEIVTSIEPLMPKVFQLIGRSDSARFTEAVVSTVNRFNIIDKAALVRELSKTLASREIEEGMRTAMDGGQIYLISQAGRVMVMSEQMAIRTYGKTPTPKPDSEGQDNHQTTNKTINRLDLQGLQTAESNSS